MAAQACNHGDLAADDETSPAPAGDEEPAASVSVEAFAALARRVDELEQKLRDLEGAARAAPAPPIEAPPPHPGWGPYAPHSPAPHPHEPHAQVPYAQAPYAQAPHPQAAHPHQPHPHHPPLLRKAEISSTIWIAGVGALIFLLGAGYFLYWSIERGHLSPPARVALGAVTGAGMAAGALRMMFGESRRLGLALYLAGLGTLLFSVYYGAMVAALFAPTMGFAAAIAVVVASAVIALRLDSEAILAVSYGLGLFAPIVFSTGTKAYAELAIYLLLLHAAGTVALHLAREGGRWHGPRLVGLCGTWLLLSVVSVDARPDQAWALLWISSAIYVVSIAWTLLPFRRVSAPVASPSPAPAPPWSGRPELVAVLWICLHVGAIPAIWIDWSRLALATKGMGGVLLAAAAISAALWPWVRRRASGDAALLLVAGVCVVIAAPVLFELDTAYLVWSVLACAAALGARLVQGEARASATAAAALVALVAVGGGTAAQIARPHDATALVNGAFGSGVLAAAAWLILTGNDRVRGLALAVGETVAHLVVAIEVFHLVEQLGASARVASIASTVLLALSAAAQYLTSFGRVAAPWPKMLALASYLLFGVVVLKLLVFDLQDTSTAVRALAALGVGVIFLGAALAANRLRRSGDSTSST